MKRVFASLLVALLLCGCGAQGGDNTGDKGKTELPQLNMETLYARLGLSEESMVAVAESMLLDLYGIEQADVKQVKITQSSDGLRADEVWLIEAVDDSAAAKIENLAKNRIQQKDDESITYSPEQNAIVKKSYLAVEGAYVFFVCHPEVDSLKVTIAAALGK